MQFSKLFNFFAVLVFAGLLCSCNASLQKASKHSVAPASKYAVSAKHKFATFIEPASYENLSENRLSKEAYQIYRSQILDEYSKMFDRSMSNIWGTSARKPYSGYIVCSVKSGKTATKCWGVAPMILTCCWYTLFGGPFGHTTYKREYVFDIYDIFGHKIKSYTVKGKKNQVMSLYSDSHLSSIELQAFKSALKDFQKSFISDLGAIDNQLERSARDYINASKEERDMVMCSWIDTNTLPSDEELVAAVRDVPDDYVGWGLMAEKNILDGDYISALKSIDRYLELNPGCTIIRPHFKKALLCNMLSKKDEALKSAIAAYLLEPSFEPSRSLLVTLLMNEGCFGDAKKLVDEELGLHPGNVQYIEAQKELKNLITESENAIQKNEEAEALGRAAAIQIIQTANQQTMSYLSTIKSSGQSYYGSRVTTIDKNDNVGRLKTKTKECSMCHGKCWIVSNDTPSFGSSTMTYCDECHREVPASHSHKQCPSCRGKGFVTTL